MLTGSILVLGAGQEFAEALEMFLPGITARHAGCAADTEGLDVDLVVVAHPQPLAEVAELRVHPRLHDKPVVVLAPGQVAVEREALDLRVAPITSTGGHAIEELLDSIAASLPASPAVA